MLTHRCHCAWCFAECEFFMKCFSPLIQQKIRLEQGHTERTVLLQIAESAYRFILGAMAGGGFCFCFFFNSLFRRLAFQIYQFRLMFSCDLCRGGVRLELSEISWKDERSNMSISGELDEDWQAPPRKDYLSLVMLSNTVAQSSGSQLHKST